MVVRLDPWQNITAVSWDAPIDAAVFRFNWADAIDSIYTPIMRMKTPRGGVYLNLNWGAFGGFGTVPPDAVDPFTGVINEGTEDYAGADLVGATVDHLWSTPPFGTPQRRAFWFDIAKMRDLFPAAPHVDVDVWSLTDHGVGGPMPKVASIDVVSYRGPDISVLPDHDFGPVLPGIADFVVSGATSEKTETVGRSYSVIFGGEYQNTDLIRISLRTSAIKFI